MTTCSAIATPLDSGSLTLIMAALTQGPATEERRPPRKARKNVAPMFLGEGATKANASRGFSNLESCCSVSAELVWMEPLSSVGPYALTGPLTRNMVGPIPRSTHVPASIGIHSLLQRFKCQDQGLE